MTDIECLLLGSTRYLGIYGASCKIISLGPKRLLKTHIFERRQSFQSRKVVALYFFRIVEFEKPQKTIHKSQKDILTINVEVI